MLVLIHGAIKQFLPLYFLKTILWLLLRTVQKDCWRLQCEAEKAGGLPCNSSNPLILPGDQWRLPYYSLTGQLNPVFPVVWGNIENTGSICTPFMKVNPCPVSWVFFWGPILQWNNDSKLIWTKWMMSPPNWHLIGY